MDGVLTVEVDDEMDSPPRIVRLSATDASYLETSTEGFGLFLKPWAATGPDSVSGKYFEKELADELAPNHPLCGHRAFCIAKNTTRDDVLFRFEDGTFAEVHLTYTQRPPEQDGWPRYKMFPTLADWMIESMVPEHIDSAL